jgi:hypothetical protein
MSYILFYTTIYHRFFLFLWQCDPVNNNSLHIITAVMIHISQRPTLKITSRKMTLHSRPLEVGHRRTLRQAVHRIRQGVFLNGAVQQLLLLSGAHVTGPMYSLDQIGVGFQNLSQGSFTNNNLFAFGLIIIPLALWGFDLVKLASAKIWPCTSCYVPIYTSSYDVVYNYIPVFA